MSLLTPTDLEVSQGKETGQPALEFEMKRWTALAEKKGIILSGDKTIEAIARELVICRQSPAIVTILGRPGTGKEGIADFIHLISGTDGPLVKTNISGMPQSLLQSELFGNTKYAFTGASDRKGRFAEIQQGGTLLLDEIGDLPFESQAILLRPLADYQRSFSKVGQNQEASVKGKMVCATNVDLEVAVRTGKMRRDFYDRISGFTVELPPFEKRDIEHQQAVIRCLADRAGKEMQSPILDIDEDAVSFLLDAKISGEIRGRKSVIDRAAAYAISRNRDEPQILQTDILEALKNSRLRRSETDEGTAVYQVNVPFEEVNNNFLDILERTAVVKKLEECNWNKSIAARFLGIERSTLDRKLKRWGRYRPD